MRYFSSPTTTTENYIVGKAVINGQLETVLLSDNGGKILQYAFRSSSFEPTEATLVKTIVVTSVFDAALQQFMDLKY